MESEIAASALLSLCSSIHRRADASATAANKIAQQIDGHEHHVTQLKILISGVEQLKLNISKLEDALKATVRPLNNNWVDVLNPLFAAYETAVEVLRMQLTSLQPIRFAESDTGFLMTHVNCTMAYNQLCAFAVDLCKREISLQFSELRLSTTRDMISLAENSVRAAANTRVDKPDINTTPIPEQTQQVPVEEASDAPPPYSTPAEPASVAPAPASTTPSSITIASPQRPKSFSFFKALTSGLRKSDPLVSTLCQAAMRGDEQQVSGLISQLANVNGRNEDGDTPLKCAIKADQPRTTRLLLNAGARPGKLPPLFKAASVGSLKVAQMLLDSTDRLYIGPKPQAYFSAVVAKGNIDGIKFLLDNNASVHTKTAGNEDIIVHAVKAKNLEVVRLLLDYGADINAENTLKQSILYIAISSGNADMVGLLLDRGASAKPAHILGTTILEATIGMKRFEIVRKLIDGGADVSGTDMHHQPLLIKVIRDPFLSNDEKVEVLRLLMDKGANPDTVDIVFGLPAICHAVEMPSTTVVEEMLRHAVNTKVRMISGQTLLTYSIDVNRQNTVRALLARGLDVNEVDGLNRTPLQLALIRQDFNLTKMLMDYGANTTVKENEQAVKFIKDIGRKDLMALLETWGAAAGPSTVLGNPSVPPVMTVPTSEDLPPSYGRAVGKC